MQRESSQAEQASQKLLIDELHYEELEPCCEDCRIEMERNPAQAFLTKERCLMGTRVDDIASGGALSWD